MSKHRWPELLREYRKQSGLTQDQLALQFDTHANTISRWESSKYEIPADVTWFLATYFFDGPYTDKTSAAIRYLSGLQAQQEDSEKDPSQGGVK